jgi:hypothetical protein
VEYCVQQESATHAGLSGKVHCHGDVSVLVKAKLSLCFN